MNYGSVNEQVLYEPLFFNVDFDLIFKAANTKVFRSSKSPLLTYRLTVRTAATGATLYPCSEVNLIRILSFPTVTFSGSSYINVSS